MSLKDVTAESFEAEVLNSTRPVVVDFWAGWCQPCKMMKPILETFASEVSEKVDVVKVDADAEGDLVAEYGVSSLPTLLVFENGKVVNKIVGAKNAVALRKELADYL